MVIEAPIPDEPVQPAPDGGEADDGDITPDVPNDPVEED